MQSCVCIVGGNRGIGNATARALHAKGYIVVVTTRGIARPELSKSILHIPEIDVTSHSFAERIFEGLKTYNVKADTFLFNAGVLHNAHSLVSSRSDMLYEYNVNAIAPLLFTDEAINKSTGQIRVFYTSSIGGSISSVGKASMPGYRMSKAALNMVARLQHIKYHEEHGHCFFALHPGVVETDMTRFMNRSDLLHVEVSGRCMADAIESLEAKDSGYLYDVHTKEVIPW